MANLNLNPAGSLWTPDGEVSLRQKDVDTIAPQQMRQFQDFHALAQRLRITLVCSLCDTAIQGQNTTGGGSHAVACQCREIRTRA